jgi:hypothetical protein
VIVGAALGVVEGLVVLRARQPIDSAFLVLDSVGEKSVAYFSLHCNTKFTFLLVEATMEKPSK